MSMKVLLVEPDWRFARMACRYLESHAHLVVPQPQPQQALDHARRWHPDLVIVAAELAENDFLRSLTALRPRPAVLMTAWPDRCDVTWRAWQVGGDELLMKPVFHAGELHEAVVTARENAAAGARRVRGRGLAASA